MTFYPPSSAATPYCSPSALHHFQEESGGREYATFLGELKSGQKDLFTKETALLCQCLLAKKTCAFLAPFMRVLVVLSPTIVDHVWMLLASRVYSAVGGSGRTDVDFLRRLRVLLRQHFGADYPSARDMPSKVAVAAVHHVMSTARPTPALLVALMCDDLIAKVVSKHFSPLAFLPYLLAPWVAYNVPTIRHVLLTHTRGAKENTPDPAPVSCVLSAQMAQFNASVGGKSLEYINSLGGIPGMSSKALFILGYIMVMCRQNLSQLVDLMPYLSTSIGALWSTARGTLLQYAESHTTTNPSVPAFSEHVASICQDIGVQVIDSPDVALHDLVRSALSTPAGLVAFMTNKSVAKEVLNNIPPTWIITGLATPSVFCALLKAPDLPLVRDALVAYESMRAIFQGERNTPLTLDFLPGIACNREMYLAQSHKPAEAAELFAWGLLDLTNFLLELFGTGLPHRTLVLYIASFLVRGSLPGKTSVVCARIAARQQAHGAPANLLTIRSATRALQLEESKQQLCYKKSALQRFQCERIVQQWNEGDKTVVLRTKLRVLTALYSTLCTCGEVAPYFLLYGMKEILQSAGTWLDAAMQFGARCKQGGAIMDDETRAQHVLILNTNGYRTLAQAAKKKPESPNAMPRDQNAKRARASGAPEAEDRTAHTLSALKRPRLLHLPN